MWIFTEEGFLSIVADQFNPGRLLVRARVRADLETFIFRCAMGTGAVIETTPERDYRFRCSVPAAVVQEWAQEMVQNITYPNFKDRVHEVDPSVARSQAYHKVWDAMYAYQQVLPLKREKKKSKGKKRQRRMTKNNVRQWRA